jgi:hypothetical protein
MKEKVYCYTSLTLSYLSRARVLAWSLKRFHPEWYFVAVITDKVPEDFIFDIDAEQFDEVIRGQELPLENMESWMFKHDLVETCTAVKGPVMDMLCQREDAGKVVYLDPDIAVFSSLDGLVSDLDEYNILLTPHQLTPDEHDLAIRDNEIGSLKHGIYNLGFVAVAAREEGKRFARWWSERLQSFCYDDIPSGLFTDQRWCDHAPAFFDGVKIIKDPGCNLASWNLSQREVDITPQGEILVNDSPLKFYHFTKYGPVGLTMTERYAADNTEVYELWAWYGRKLTEFTPSDVPEGYWAFAHFRNNEPIQKEHRLLYRQRADLQDAFPDPYAESFHDWLVKNS